MLNKVEFNPCIVVLAGAPLSGKTTLGKELAGRTNFLFLDIDEQGKKLDPMLSAQPGPLANTGRMMLKYGYLNSLAANGLTEGRPVLLAATFSHDSYVNYLRALADLDRRLNQSQESALRFFVLDTPEENLPSRIEERVKKGSDSDVVTLDRAIAIRERFVPIKGDDVVQINTGLPLEINVTQILTELHPFRKVV